MLSDMSGKHAASRNAARRLRVSARWPPSSPTSTDASVMHAHCTAWKAPVRPRGRPFSTIIASVSTSVNARPSAIKVNRPTPSTRVKSSGPPRSSSSGFQPKPIPGIITCTTGSGTVNTLIGPSEMERLIARIRPAAPAIAVVSKK